MEHFPDAVEIHPCVIVGQDSVGNDITEQCDSDDPSIACWSVYWHSSGERGLLHIEDFKTEEEARAAAVLLEKALDALSSHFGIEE